MNPNETLTVQDYKNAIASQNACNLSGLAHSLSMVLHRIWASNTGGTDAVNRHPIVVLYVTQMAYLSGVASFADHDAWSTAMRACEKAAAE